MMKLYHSMRSTSIMTALNSTAVLQLIHGFTNAFC